MPAGLGRPARTVRPQRVRRPDFPRTPTRPHSHTLFLALGLCLALAPARASAQTRASAPSLRAELIAQVQERARAGEYAGALARLRADAERALALPTVAVTDKKRLLPPGGDAHDYYSLSPYWWPDPAKPDGLPYIRRDGEVNPESKQDLDQPRVAELGARVQALALAYALTGEDRYAAGAARQLRAWFLDPATRMSPHLRYAQLVRGNPAERGSGIIDTRWFIEVVDGAALVAGSNSWPPAAADSLRAWMKAYLDWLRASPNGQHEAQARNNHGSWYAAQTAALALFVGDTAYVKRTAEAARARIGWQIRPDGSQPIELERTRSLHYSGFNAEALSRLAELGRQVGVDLWDYSAPEGGSLRATLDHLADYAGREKSWPGQQIDQEDQALELLYLRRGLVAYPGDSRIATGIDRLPKDLVETDRSGLIWPQVQQPQAQGKVGPDAFHAEHAEERRTQGFLVSDPAAARVRGNPGPPRPPDQTEKDPFPASSAPRRSRRETMPFPSRGWTHPSIFLTHADALAIRAAEGRYPLLDRSLAEARAVVAHALQNPLDVPPPGEAGSYAHERHKQNYRELQLAGELYQITGDARYARFVWDMLEKYAVLYPTLGPSPYARDQAPGKLFHQSLNEANWLAATAIAYDCVYDALTPAERKRFEANVFRPMADWLSVSQAREFDRIHNHGTWATAAVGMIGYVMGDTSYVNRALYGTKRDGTGGFLRQLDLLFSPDGYYMEGAYYIRYALMPFYYFAEAIQRAQPELGIYRRRDGVLGKGLYSALQLAFPNGVFAPINDASRTMAVDAPEVVVALDEAYARYGANPNLLATAALQGQVVLNGAGLAVARDLATTKAAPSVAWKSTEFTDGPDGKEGGLGILRSGAGADATMLLMKYGVHGQGHGHFDKLHFILFDGGHEVVPDYGFARWINIEPKRGGRYLPENDSWAKQTLAHNTVVVDSASQSGGNYRADEAKSAQRNFFDAHDPAVQVMSARADGFYDGVGMQRTMLLIRDARLPLPVVVDLFRLTSAAPHSYDWPLHFRGQLVAAGVTYDPHVKAQAALGSHDGYQHVWNEATAVTDSTVRITWLDGQRYYSLTMAGASGTQLIFGRTGAGDPEFNLVSEPLVLVRRQAATHLVAAVLEPHGFFSEAEERSEGARPRITDVRVLGDDGDASVVEVLGAGGLRWVVMIANGSPSGTTRHRVVAGGKSYEWTGNYAVEGVER